MEVIDGQWRQGGERKGDQGRGVEIKGGVWGLVEAWEAQGLEPHCWEVRRRSSGQVGTAEKACGEAE